MTRLCDLSGDGNSVTSVSWSERGNQVAVGTHHGYVTVWDVTANKQVSVVWHMFIHIYIPFKCQFHGKLDKRVAQANTILPIYNYYIGNGRWSANQIIIWKVRVSSSFE